MSNHQNESTPQAEAAKVKLSVIIADQPSKPTGLHSSLKIEENVPRKGPKPKARNYPMSATAAEMKKLRPPPPLEEVEKLVWLTTRAAAKYLSISPAAVRMMVRRKQLPAYRPFGGRKLYFKRSDLDRAIESSKKGGSNGNN